LEAFVGFVRSSDASSRRGTDARAMDDLNAIRWNDWKVSFATEDGNIATALRNVPGWPVITLGLRRYRLARNARVSPDVARTGGF
jgi:hypothetical protein